MVVEDIPLVPQSSVHAVPDTFASHSAHNPAKSILIQVESERTCCVAVIYNLRLSFVSQFAHLTIVSHELTSGYFASI